MATLTKTFAIDVVIDANFIFLYQVLETQFVADETVELSFYKSTVGAPISKSILLPPPPFTVFISFSFDGTTFHDEIEFYPGMRPRRIPSAAIKARIRLPSGTATTENQELIKDGGAGDFNAATDSLHDIRVYLEAAFGTLSTAVTGIHTITPAHGIVEQTIAFITSTRNLPFEAYFDVNTLVAAGEGGLVTFRLKSEVDGANLRTIDLSSFMVGTDEIHPVLEGFSDIGANTMSLTVQCSIAVSANRIIPYRILGGIL